MVPNPHVTGLKWERKIDHPVCKFREGRLAALLHLLEVNLRAPHVASDNETRVVHEIYLATNTTNGGIAVA